MNDGANLGITAERALKTILGGEEPPGPEEERTPAFVRAWLETITHEQSKADYSSACDYTAKLILEFLEKDPTHLDIPSEGVYKKNPDGTLIFDNGNLILETVGLYDRMKEAGYKFDLGLTGFQWSFAVNTARFCLEAPSVPNSAIIEIKT